jgi:hypothetical protein
MDVSSWILQGICVFACNFYYSNCFFWADSAVTEILTEMFSNLNTTFYYSCCWIIYCPLSNQIAWFCPHMAFHITWWHLSYFSMQLRDISILDGVRTEGRPKKVCYYFQHKLSKWIGSYVSLFWLLMLNFVMNWWELSKRRQGRKMDPKGCNWLIFWIVSSGGNFRQ